MIFFSCSLFVVNEMRENIKGKEDLKKKNVTYERGGVGKGSSSRRK